MIRWGYDAGELWLHDPISAIELLSDIGYTSVSLRSRRGVLVPGTDDFAARWREVVELAKDRSCQLVIDTTSSFVLDARVRDLPPLASDAHIAEPTRNWIAKWIESIRIEMSPRPVLVFGSGVAVSSDRQSDWERLADSIVPLIRLAADRDVRLAIRPAVGQSIDTLATLETFDQWLPRDCKLWLAADVAEMMAAGEMPLSARLQRNRDRLAMVTLPFTDPDGTWQNGDSWAELAWDRLHDVLEGLPLDGPAIVRFPGHSAAGTSPAERAWAMRPVCRQRPTA